VQTFTAPEQSLATTGPAGGGGGDPQGWQMTFPIHPVEVTEASEVNLKVKQPAVEVKLPVNVLVIVAISGAAVEFPLYTYKKSKLFSRFNDVI
jgi:hypothetical protein